VCGIVTIAREVSPRWRNRQLWIRGHRPGSMFSCGRLSGRVDRLDQQQHWTHVTSPLAVSRQRGRRRDTTPLLTGWPALSGSRLRGAQPVRPVYPTSPESDDDATICRLTGKNETWGQNSCPDNDFGLMTTISAIAPRARLHQQHEIRIRWQLADGPSAVSFSVTRFALPA